MMRFPSLFLATIVLLATAVAGTNIHAPRDRALGRMEVGVVMNIDTADEARYQRHFEIADGWATTVRVQIGMDMEGWNPDPSKISFARLKKLAHDCAARGLKMDIVLGGVPDAKSDSWRKLGVPAGAYSGHKVSEMPQSWWQAWANWQREAVKVVVAAYGSTSGIRLQMLNEPYDRGEDDSVDALLAYAVPRMVDWKGTVAGCPLDGPSLWGDWPQLKKQIDGLKARMAKYPQVYKFISQIPLNVYPAASEKAYHDPDTMISEYSDLAMKALKYVKDQTGKDAYFSEVGVSHVYDVWPKIWGSQTDEVAERVLTGFLQEINRRGARKVTVYQTMDGSLADEQAKGFGLADHTGKLRIDLQRFSKAINSMSAKM